jgi:hypothetical protein
MRQRPFRRSRLVAVLGALALTATSARAQTGDIPEGAPELIRATGARTLGMGLAGVSAASGAEAVWWNPALVARSGREARLDVRSKASAGEPESDAAGIVIIPIQRVGVVGLTLRYINNGTFEVTNPGSGDPVGSFVTTNTIIAATFATTFSDRVAAGVTAKQLRVRLSCTGDCTQVGDDNSNEPTVSALDFGTHVFVRRDSTLSIGVAVRNLGPRFQIRDSPQADPLPERGELGIQYAPKTPRWPGVRVRAAGDVVTRLVGGTGLGYRFGGEATYLDRYAVRAGYMVYGPGEISSPTLGLGLSTTKLSIDISQMMTDLGSQGSRPTFLSLRYRF